MGQIQNSLNQVFTSLLGAGLAYQHSPYVKKQQAYAYADAKINELESVEDDFYGTQAQYLKEKVPDISKYDWSDKNLNKEITDLYTGLLENDKLLEEAYKEREETILRLGTNKERQEVLQDRSERRITRDVDEKTPAQRVVERLEQAYKGKQEVQSAVPGRKGLLERYNDWTNKGETVPETPDTYEETENTRLYKSGSRLYKG